MATQWGATILGSKNYGASGTRDVLIIAQDDCLQGPDIVQRRGGLELTDSDKNQLQRLGIPQANWQDNASIMEARFVMDKDYTLLPTERGRPGNDLSKVHVLSRIENYMKTTMKDGLIIYYFGPGKQSTGDWCFKDGFITFKELAEMYLKNFKGRVLTIDTDCSYAGNWIKAAIEFFEEMDTKPCGHSVKEKGILLKVFASCKSNQIPYKLAYSLHGTNTDKNSGELSIKPSGKEIEKSQHIKSIDATVIRCENKDIDAECKLKPDDTWHKWNLSDRIFLLRGDDKGRPAWHYLLLVDDEETVEKFTERTQGPNSGKYTVNCNDYGQVLKSGFGTDPPNDVKEWMENNYGVS